MNEPKSSHKIGFINRRVRPKRDGRLDPDGGFCFTQEALRLMTKHPRVRMEMLIGGEWISRKFCEVEVCDEPYWVDIVTGHLFRMNGESATGSTLRVRAQ